MLSPQLTVSFSFNELLRLTFSFGFAVNLLLCLIIPVYVSILYGCCTECSDVAML